ncbi:MULTISPECIES: TetR/AcrR family transcriptional regulator [Zunongwangia]|uniref:TetR/AcrR family transcriptional regulator n=1 Tax=Zunongwangia endophytica TaxID=1808945 RepID=A0ABV8HBD3_9FLAO|nr:TetR/AcrR family transcriptional regulator [Zunongwangia endophytica]MDN3596877.1 TetR/AcrR family transcriptional regulator [Zunongwangia endophytica]
MKDSKGQILKTSLLLFLQKGFKEVTMKEIVKSSGFSKGAFYHYFSSKEEVFKEVIDVYFSQMLHFDYNTLPSNSLQSFYQANLKILQERDSILQSWYKETFEGDFPNNMYYILFDALRLLPEVKEQQTNRIQEELKAWEKVITNAMTTGEIKTTFSPKNLAKQFVYSSDGIAMHMIMISSSEKLFKEVKEIWDSLYESVKA